MWRLIQADDMLLEQDVDRTCEKIIVILPNARLKTKSSTAMVDFRIAILDVFRKMGC